MAINRNFIVRQGIQVGANATCGNTWTSNDFISDKQYVGSDSVLELNFTKGSIDPRIQSSRNTNATTVAANGKIVVVTANTPRVEYSLSTGQCLGLVAEEARTNFCSFSDIEGSVGEIARGFFAAGPNAQQPRVSQDVWIGPNRTSARHVWVEGGDNNVGYIGTIPNNPPANTLWTGSIYVYLPSNSSVTTCSVTLESGTLTLSPNITGSANASIRDQWQRIVCQGYVTGGTGSATPVLRIEPIGAVVYSDCWQLEKGEYASTWIPTTNVTSASRNDDFNYIMLTSNEITVRNLSFAVEAAPKWTANVLLSTANTAGNTINPSRGIAHLNTDVIPLSPFGGEPYYGYGVTIRPGTSTNAIQWGSRALANTTYGFANSGTALGNSILSSGYNYVGQLAANTSIKLAAAVDTSTSRVGLNGTQQSIVDNSTTSTLYQSIFETYPFNRIILGYQAQGGTGPLVFGGHIKRFSLFQRLLSNTEIIALTET